MLESFEHTRRHMRPSLFAKQRDNSTNNDSIATGITDEEVVLLGRQPKQGSKATPHDFEHAATFVISFRDERPGRNPLGKSAAWYKSVPMNTPTPQLLLTSQSPLPKAMAKILSSLLVHAVTAAVVLAISNASGVFALPQGWDKLDHEAREILARATPAAPHFVVYGDAYDPGTTGPPPTSDITGFNVFALSFLLLEGAWDKAEEWTTLTASQRSTVKSQYASAGISLIVSAFGSTDVPTSSGADPIATANTMAAWVIEYDLDGIDVDYEVRIHLFTQARVSFRGSLQDFNAFDGGTGSAENWLISFTQQLRTQLPEGQYILTHAPVAPWFAPNLWGGGGYLKVNSEVGSLIDWYNVQFYNQGSSEYTTCSGLLTTSSSTWPETALFQIAASGVPLSKLVIGKPATSSDASNGFMSTSTLASCVSQAKSEGWNAGVMVWEFPDAASAWITAESQNLSSCSSKDSKRFSTASMVSQFLSRLVCAAGLFTCAVFAAPTGQTKRDVPAAPHFVLYTDKWVSGETGPPSVSSIDGFNVLALSFLLIEGAWDQAEVWASLTDDERSTIKSQYNDAGIKLIVSAFGSSDVPTSAGADPVATANTMAAWVQQYNLDGIDVDYEDFNAIDDNEGGEEWLITFTQQLRSQLPQGEYIITHAPVAPWFEPNVWGGGGYLKVDQAVGDLIDWYNVQFYNQGTTEYTDCNGLLTDSSSQNPGSALFQIAANGVSLDKLVIGKPANSGDANNGYIDPATLATCVEDAKNQGWDAGVMVWEFPDAAASWIETVRADSWPVHARYSYVNTEKSYCVHAMGEIVRASAPAENKSIFEVSDLHSFNPQIPSHPVPPCLSTHTGYVGFDQPEQPKSFTINPARRHTGNGGPATLSTLTCTNGTTSESMITQRERPPLIHLACGNSIMSDSDATSSVAAADEQVLLATNYLTYASISVTVGSSGGYSDSRPIRSALHSVIHSIMQTCTMRTFVLSAIVELMPIVIAAVFSALRVFALLEHGYICSIWVLACGLGPVVMNLYEVIMVSSVFYADDNGSKLCAGILKASVASPKTVLTCCKTQPDNREFCSSRQAISLNIQSVSKILLQDGSIYFIASLGRNVVEGATTLSDILSNSQDSMKAALAEPIATVSGTLQSILISRFIVNLRHASSNNESTLRSFSRFSGPHFRIPQMITAEGIIESMGGPLEFREQVLWEEEDHHTDSDEEGLKPEDEAGPSVRRDLGSDRGQLVEECD
ncbi:hypothetical protein NM688_g1316 [Phlebia brevispora]|uniref:Uncharacterized protein n=1 Tax=Phlebia brevispora TaxID=194682 RepID=A0ACC1TC57_9APHY|nr:hypothetical protein NM688_g1316 [Phlebia brevispora]